MAGLRNIRSITIERHFGNTPDSEIWTEIARLCGYNIKFTDVKNERIKPDEDNRNSERYQ